MLKKFLITLVLLITPTIYSAAVATRKRPASTSPSPGIAKFVKQPKPTRLQVKLNVEQAEIAKRAAEYEIKMNAMEAAERKDWKLRETRLANLYLGLVAQKGVTECIATNPRDYADYLVDYTADAAKNYRAANQTYLGKATQKMLAHVADPAKKAPVFQALKVRHDRILQLDAEIAAHTSKAKDSTLDLAQRSEHHKALARLERAKKEMVKKNQDTHRFLEDFTTRHFRADVRVASGFFGLMAACETKMREQAKVDRKRVLSTSPVK